MASPGKVLILVENLPVPFDRRVWMEATALRQSGYEVSVICPVGKGCEREYEELEGIHIYRHPLPPERSSAAGYIREYLWALRWEFRLARRVWKERGGFDLIHLCNPPDLLFLVALRYKLLRGVRVIFDQHDLNPELYEAKFGKRDLFYHALRLAEKWTFRTADAVISTNESYREVALQRGGKKPEQVFVVRSGPDLSRFVPQEGRADYRGDAAWLVGYVGVMGEQEGIDVLLQAVRELVHVRGRRDIRFMLIGGGPAVPDMKRLAADLGVADCVEFAGRVPDEELIARLSSCDVCVNPDPKTPFNDRSTMNKILEYMALGKPIVQFDLLEGRRSAGEASLYAEPNDPADFAGKIEALLADPEERARRGAIGYARMRDVLEWRHQIPQLEAAYRYALDAGGKTHRGRKAHRGGVELPELPERMLTKSGLKVER